MRDAQPQAAAHQRPKVCSPKVCSRAGFGSAVAGWFSRGAFRLTLTRAQVAKNINDILRRTNLTSTLVLPLAAGTELAGATTGKDAAIDLGGAWRLPAGAHLPHGNTIHSPPPPPPPMHPPTPPHPTPALSLRSNHPPGGKSRPLRDCCARGKFWAHHTGDYGLRARPAGGFPAA
jgi:hypothetical protein